MNINESLIDLFYSRIKNINENDCWEYAHDVAVCGYGRFSFNNIREYAHRFSYMIHNGEIKNNLYVCHTCDNKVCVNPWHLWLGTNSENIRDKIEKNRHLDNRKTRVICRRGHGVYGSNLYVRPNGQRARVCKQCRKIDRRIRYIEKGK